MLVSNEDHQFLINEEERLEKIFFSYLPLPLYSFFHIFISINLCNNNSQASFSFNLVIAKLMWKYSEIMYVKVSHNLWRLKNIRKKHTSLKMSSPHHLFTGAHKETKSFLDLRLHESIFLLLLLLLPHLLLIFWRTCGMWKFPGQGSNPRHSSDIKCCGDNARSLTLWVTRELSVHQSCSCYHVVALYSFVSLSDSTSDFLSSSLRTMAMFASAHQWLA